MDAWNRESHLDFRAAIGDGSCTGPVPRAHAAMNVDSLKLPDSYYEHLAEIMGQEAADWARLPRAERERELTRHHMLYNTPDDLSLWPAELDGGVDRP